MRRAEHSRGVASFGCNIWNDYGRYPTVPVGLRLERSGQGNQLTLAAGPANNLKRDRHAASVKADWQRHRRQTEVVHEAREAAERVERPCAEFGRRRIGL